MDETFRIATFNVHHCEGRDGRVDVGRIARIVDGLAADLIVLQELDVGLERSRSADQPAELARHLDLDVRFFPTLDIGAGRYGLGIAGRGLDDFSSEQLPRVGGEEPRVVVAGEWQGVGVLATHLSRNEKARVLQTERLAEIAAAAKGPVVLLGDLNQPATDLRPLTRVGLKVARPRRPLMSRLRPIYQVDHILVGSGLDTADVRTIRTIASDHDPLVGTVVRRGR